MQFAAITENRILTYHATRSDNHIVAQFYIGLYDDICRNAYVLSELEQTDPRRQNHECTSALSW